MRGINKVTLIGHLGADPEVRYLEDGTCVANINLATTESYKNKEGEKVENTEWHRVVFWRFLAELAEKYLKKGRLVYVEGKLQTRQWQDKEGNTRYTTEIRATEMQMLDKGDRVEGTNTEETSYKPKQQTEETPAAQPVAAEAASSESKDDDLPF